MSLRQRAHDALIIKNDIECVEALNTLRRECREQGLDPERVNKIIRSENHAIRKANELPKPNKPEQPPAQESVTPEPPQSFQDSRTDKELSRRAPKSSEPIPDGLTSSGTRKSGAAGGRSIVDGIL